MYYTHKSTHAQPCGKFIQNKCFGDQVFGVNKAGDPVEGAIFLSNSQVANVVFHFQCD